MRKGFTLIELTAALVILVLVSLVAVPKVNTIIKDNKYDSCEIIVKTIEDAATQYLYKHSEIVDELEYDSYYITIGDLIDEGLLDDDITNPCTNEVIDFDTEIEIYDISGGFNIDIDCDYACYGNLWRGGDVG